LRAGVDGTVFFAAARFLAGSGLAPVAAAAGRAETFRDAAAVARATRGSAPVGFF
jgi:hypothetical protein